MMYDGNDGDVTDDDDGNDDDVSHWDCNDDKDGYDIFLIYF